MTLHINSHINAFHTIAMSSRFCKQMSLFCYFVIFFFFALLLFLLFIYYSCFHILFSFSFISSVFFIQKQIFSFVPRSQNMVERSEGKKKSNKKRRICKFWTISLFLRITVSVCLDALHLFFPFLHSIFIAILYTNTEHTIQKYNIFICGCA